MDYFALRSRSWSILVGLEGRRNLDAPQIEGSYREQSYFEYS